MLDHQQRDAVVAQRPDKLHDLLHLGLIERGHHLVEQQHFRTGAQRAREFDPGALRERQIAGLLVRYDFQADPIEACQRLASRRLHAMVQKARG